MQKATLDRSIYATALVGVLVVVHLWLMVDRGFDRGCFGFSDPTPVVECEAVIQSDAGFLFGISNSVWGLVFYVAVAALSFLIGMGSQFASRGRVLRVVMVYAGFSYSAYLVYVQATQIGSWCKLCLISAAVVAVLTALVSYELFGKQKES